MRLSRALARLLNLNQVKQISIITEALPTERKETSPMPLMIIQQLFKLIISISKHSITELSAGTRLENLKKLKRIILQQLKCSHRTFQLFTI